MITTMGFMDLFTSKKEKAVDALMARVQNSTADQEAATSRLQLTIERVIDAKTGRDRYAQAHYSSSKDNRD